MAQFLCIRADIIFNWIWKNHIDMLIDFPPYNPDLNPLEHIWAAIKRFLNCNPWIKISTFWNNIHLDYNKSLILSMPHRLEAVIELRADTLSINCIRLI